MTDLVRRTSALDQSRALERCPVWVCLCACDPDDPCTCRTWPEDPPLISRIDAVLAQHASGHPWPYGSF